MLEFFETTDWSNAPEPYPAAGVMGYLQPGYAVSGSVDAGAGDAVDMINVPMVGGVGYTFTFSGDSGLTFSILDDLGDVLATGGPSLTFTPDFPSTNYFVQVEGTGAYTVALEGVAADYMPDEDGGVLNPIPIELGSAVSGLINGNENTVSEPDFYSFYADAGDVLNFQMSQANSVFGPTAGGLLRLYDSEGNEVDGTSWFASGWDGYATLSYTVTVPGVYVIAADTYGMNYAGSYVLETSLGGLPLSPQASLTGSALMDGGDNWFEQVTIGLSAAHSSDVTVQVTVRAFDADSSVTPVVTTYSVVVPAGQTSVEAVLNLGAQSALAGIDSFQVSLSEVEGAGLVADAAFGDVQTAAAAVPGPVWQDGTAGNDVIHGTVYDDRIDGLAGIDRIYGEAGNDTLMGGTGNDRLEGGDGDDELDGGDQGDILVGDAGNDTLLGGAGADRLVGGAGDDDMHGGDTSDLLLGLSGIDHMNGDAGNDTLRGGEGDDIGLGGVGDDVVIGGTGRDLLDGGDDNDIIRGNGGFDIVYGGTGDDFVAGGAQADRVYGDTGNDTLSGGGGFDTLDGGTGDDVLTGDFNADRFVFVDGHGNDTITDFEATNNAEKIDLSGISAISVIAELGLGSATSGAAIQVGADVVIDTGGGSSITLLNVDLADLDANDFIF
ncbi:MAG: calcium-binding protein [Paracoccaceae bacterium]